LPSAAMVASEALGGRRRAAGRPGYLALPYRCVSGPFAVRVMSVIFAAASNGLFMLAEGFLTGRPGGKRARPGAPGAEHSLNAATRQSAIPASDLPLDGLNDPAGSRWRPLGQSAPAGPSAGGE
jgi:hypothetical protein